MRIRAALLAALSLSAPGPVLAQVDTASTATLSAAAPAAAAVPAPLEVDRLGERMLYVGTPILLPAPPAAPPKPPEPEPEPKPEPTPETKPEPAPALVPPPPALLPPPLPPPSVEPERPHPRLIGELAWIERFRSSHGVLLIAAIVVLMVSASLLSSFIRRQNDRLSMLARLASGSNKLLRILAAMLLLLLAVAWLPSDALPFALLAAALAIGWSLRDVLPDLIAGVVLAFERRIRPGMWLAGDGFAGVVERVGLRATWLRDATDRRVSVPNRTLVSSPITSDDGRWPTREVTLRIEQAVSAETIRRAIVDAVLASPWTPVSESPSVQRDGSDPCMWHVRARVLDLSFAGQFEGELLERAEAMLTRQA